MVYTREEAAARSLRSKTNTPGTCQLWTRTQFGAPSAGDQDRDGDADAVDGWKLEPEKYKHRGDRKPPLGTPVAWSGGRNGFGHRAISLGPINGVYHIRSTDAGGSGKVATVPLTWPETTWGLKYEGWSESMSGLLIPQATPPKPKTSRGVRVDKAIEDTKAAIKAVKNSKAGKPTEARAKLLDTAQKQLESALKNLEKIPFVK